MINLPVRAGGDGRGACPGGSSARARRALLAALEWGGCAAGLAGSLLLALDASFSGWGFVAYLASNLCWSAFAVATRCRGLLAMQAGFTATSLLGLWRWM